MKITLSLPNPVQEISQKQRILNKLNLLVGGKDFFTWEDDRLCCGGCSNSSKHNKVVIFLALLVDSHQDSSLYNFTSFGYKGGVGFDIGNSLLDKLENTLDNIKTVRDINISIK